MYPINVPSIYELEPLEEGGREARIGFSYQDHVAVSFCLDLLEQPELVEVWCETHDDITLLWLIGNKIIVEFVQVKSADLLSRWSIPILCERQKENKIAKTGTSVFEQSLARARCGEPVRFRLVTPIDVNTDLEVLKLPLNHADRDETRIEVIRNAIETKIPGLKSPTGVHSSEWVDACVWDKRDSEASIINSNMLRLEQVLISDGYETLPDQRTKIYEGLLFFVQNASKVDKTLQPDGHKIKPGILREHIAQNVRLLTSAVIAQSLRTKMEDGDIAELQIELAEELRRAYRSERISANYMQSDALKYMEREVTAVLASLLARLYSGVIVKTGPEFHELTLSSLDTIRDGWPSTLPLPGKSVVYGYMYEKAKRCVYRFDKAQP